MGQFLPFLILSLMLIFHVMLMQWSKTKSEISFYQSNINFVIQFSFFEIYMHLKIPFILFKLPFTDPVVLEINSNQYFTM